MSPRGRCPALLAAASLVLSPIVAQARQDVPVKPSPAVYQPETAEERGLWLEMDEAERSLKTSRFVVRDAALNAYVRGVLCREVGEARCGAVRLYIIRTPHFNATMMPNGALQIWTGTLLRLRNEAQLAAVLGHEFAHFEKKHSLQNFRAVRGKTDAMAWLSFFGLIGALANIGILGSIFSFGQDMEREADVTSLEYMRSGGYSPAAASAVWAQVIAEGDATALARQQKKRRHQGGGFLDSHPANADRMAYLGELARKGPPGANGPGMEGIDSYRAAMAAWWAPLIDDQVKLNDFGGTEFLLARLAEHGWTSELLYARGELYRTRAGADDFEKSVEYYRGAVAAERPVAEAWRGLGLSLLRTGGDDEGRQMLKRYLELRPEAPDKSMITMLAGG